MLAFLFLSQHQSSQTITKIYIGYLPVSIDETTLREVFGKHATVMDVIIKKGNAQGQFDRFCYGFVCLACSHEECGVVIGKVAVQNPSWRMKIKDEAGEVRAEKVNRPQYNNTYNNYNSLYNIQPNEINNNYPNNYNPTTYQPIQQPPPPQHTTQPSQSITHPPHTHPSHTYPTHPQNYQPQYRPPKQSHLTNQPNEKGEIYGEKMHQIMVRELWLGGIPEMINHQTMSSVMLNFGMVEGTEIFPKFAFIKFKRAYDAATAFERAEKIHEMFGNNPGFKISFSDPSRRKDIVGNHYEFERNSQFLPILFLGFPPITSAKIEINHMKSICEKYGTIKNYFLKKSTNSQMRSYFLFTYECVKTALKAKQELFRRKDLLGEKRVQLALLLDEGSVIAGRDLTYTEKKFLPDGIQRVKKPTYQNFPQQQTTQQSQQPQQSYQNNYSYQNPPPNNFGYNPYPFYQNPNYYYPGEYQQLNQERQGPAQEVLEGGSEKQDKGVFSLIEEVLDDNPKNKGTKVPAKNEGKDEDPADIITKMLGKGDEEGEIDSNEDAEHDNEPNWSGFLVWKGEKRTGVDGYAKEKDAEVEFGDYSVSINSVIDPADIILKERKNMMTLEPTNSIAEPTFKEYLKLLKGRVGVAVTKTWLIYVMNSETAGQKLTKIKDNQLLIVMEKHQVSQLINSRITAL